MPNAINPRVSVVIASHRDDYIAACVESIGPEVVGDIATEVIVVADYPVTGYARTFGRVHWFFHENISISEKRNIGVSRARGSYIGFIDDDCVAQPGWVPHAVQFLEKNPSNAGVAGSTKVESANKGSFPAKEFKRLETPGFRTNNIFYRKDILEKAGGFDERFTVQREDADLAFTVLSMGLLIGHSPDVKVVHRHRPGERWDLLKNCVNRRFDPLLYKKHKKLYRTWIKSPMTPAIGAVFLAHALLTSGLYFGGIFLTMTAIGDAWIALLLALRRNNIKQIDIIQIVCDWAAYGLSPFVLGAALVYGGIRFRKLLIV